MLAQRPISEDKTQISEDKTPEETFVPYLENLHKAILNLSDENIISFLHSVFHRFTNQSFKGDVDELYEKFSEEVQVYFKDALTNINKENIIQFNSFLNKLSSILSSWICEFPNKYVSKIKSTFTDQISELMLLERIVNESEIEDFIYATATDITPRIISVLGLLTKIMEKEFLLSSDQIEIIENSPQEDAKIEPMTSLQTFKQNLIRQFYYPIIYTRFYKFYLLRFKNVFHDLDKTIQRLPVHEVELINDIKQIKSDLQQCINQHPTPENIKLVWELSRDTRTLTEFVLSKMVPNKPLPLKEIDEKADQYYNKWILSNRIKHTDNNCNKLKKSIGAFLCGLLLFTLLVGFILLSSLCFGTNLLALILASSILKMTLGSISIGLFAGSGILGYCFFRNRACFRSDLIQSVDQYQRQLLAR